MQRAKIKLEALAKQRAERTQAVAAGDPTNTGEASRLSSDDFDPDTRERLAEVDVRRAAAKSNVAKYDYEAHRDANKKAPGSTPQAEMKKLELEWHVAQIEVERAQAMLEGIRKQRAEDPSADHDKRRQSRNPDLIDKESRAATSDDEFDLETRERLAQFDVQDAQEGVAGAEEELARNQELRKNNVISENEAHVYERQHRHALIELERAKLKLEAIGKQRAELEAAGDIAVVEAEAEVQKARATVHVTEAQCEAAVVQAKKQDADVAAAEATLDYRQKEYQRMKTLYEQAAVSERDLRETDEKIESAKEALDNTRAVVRLSKTNIAESEAHREEALAGLRVAEARLRAAQQRRDRLIHREAVEQKGENSTPPLPPGNGGAPAKSE